MDLPENNGHTSKLAETAEENTSNITQKVASPTVQIDATLNGPQGENNEVHKIEIHEEPINENILLEHLSTTESDAVHPRFQTQDPEEVKQWQIKYDYHCAFCDEYFAPSVTALKLHFKGDMVQHEPCGSCFYCKGDVFSYTSNNQRQLYHDCRQQHKD